MQNYIDRHETSQLLSKTTLSDKRVYTAIEFTSYKNDGEMCQKDEENVHTSTKSINFKFMVGLTVLFLVVLVASILVVEHTRDITQYSLFKYIPTSFFFGALLRYHHHRHIVYHHIPRDYNNRQLRCSDNICFQPPQPDNDTPQVATNRPGFPSYWNHATGVSPIDVSYDERSILLNGQRSLFIGGSMHPARATPLTWEHALDRAVDNGLNLITVYVIWASHQPTANSTLDWNLTPRPISGAVTEWSISSAIRSAAKRGLFVHVRVGPFVCGEYNYGGIPEWVPLLHPDMELRRLDSRWMDIMEQYVSSIVSYLQKERLFAYQGGPIIMAQIENEINGDVETGVVTSDDDHISYSDLYYSERRSTSRERVHGRHQNGRILRQSSSSFQSSDLQGYAEWSGQLAKKLAPEVVWTMCNGLSASNTIETYNGQFFDVSWLENYGASHRIQVDRPALWTEHEGGFQIWGDEPDRPSDYFWGETARAMSYSSIRWLARGGSHINYYMFWGGYNRERAAGGGITNAYAVDAILCPSGQPHQPKFDHFATLANLIAKHASILLDADSALRYGEQLYVKNSRGHWIRGDNQLAFYYVGDDEKGISREIVFAENSASVSYTVEIPVGRNWRRSFTAMDDLLVINMAPYSAVVIVDGYIRFDSADIDLAAKSYERRTLWNPVELQNWMFVHEPVGAAINNSWTVTTRMPIEQTYLHSMFDLSSDYAWFETEFTLKDTIDSVTISIGGDTSSAFVVYIDDQPRGHGDYHLHKDGRRTVRMSIGRMERGLHRISILSESLGYYNVIGAWNISTRAKQKGITDQVILTSSMGEIDLTDGRYWRSYPSLHLNPTNAFSICTSPHVDGMGPLWASTSFATPSYNADVEILFLSVRSGRGHVWINGNDLGRFWNITRSDGMYTQQYYQLPDDYLYHDGRHNELVFFDALGNISRGSVSLLISSIVVSSHKRFEDEIDYPDACL